MCGLCLHEVTMGLIAVLRRRLLRLCPTYSIGIVILLCWISLGFIILIRKGSYRKSIVGDAHPPFTTQDTNYLIQLSEKAKKDGRLITDEELFENPDLRQDNPRLLAYIREHGVLPPPSQLPGHNYNRAAHKKRLRAFGITSIFHEHLHQLFGHKKGGLFIEAGANDGIFLSNTLGLERDHNWTGLLIEPNKYAYFGLKRLKRNAWISNACLATGPVPQKAEITQFVGRKFNGDYRGAGFIESEFPREKYKPGAEQGVISGGKSNCYPLYSLLLAIGMPQVDYFSLDVQGIEMKILLTIPFDKVKIRVISVEHNIIPEERRRCVNFWSQRAMSCSSRMTPTSFLCCVKP